MAKTIMQEQEDYYSAHELIKHMIDIDSHYGIIYGQRSNGKSYDIKHVAVYHSLGKSYYPDLIKPKDGIAPRFILLRRWSEDVDYAEINRYFRDIDVKKITNKAYDCIMAYGEGIYLMEFDNEKMNYKRGPMIGEICSLNMAEHYKSNSFENIDIILFEEFITKKMYLRDEPTELQHFVSTVFRQNREGKFIFMIGNTITKIVPYFTDWCLKGVRNQKQGTIAEYHVEKYGTEEKEKICVEYARQRKIVNGKKTLFFGKASENIDGGVWESSEWPHLPCTYEELKIVHKVTFTSMEFAFRICLAQFEKNYFLYIYPLENLNNIERTRHSRVITDLFNPSPYYSTWFKKEIQAEVFMDNLLKDNKVCYSDNMCGEDFNTLLKNYKRKI